MCGPIFRHRWAAPFNHWTRDPIILCSGMFKCCYTLCTAAELKWSGNGDGSKFEVEIVRD